RPPAKSQAPRAPAPRRRVVAVLGRCKKAGASRLATVPKAMRLIQRYLFHQLLLHILVTTAALTGVAVLTARLSALDVLVDDRQSPLIFAEITLLATPQIVAMILPLAVCVAGLVCLNRLHTEQEIVICFAGGMSRWAVAAPAIRLAVLVAIVNLVINLWVQPACFREMRNGLQSGRTRLA